MTSPLSHTRAARGLHSDGLRNSGPGRTRTDLRNPTKELQMSIAFIVVTLVAAAWGAFPSVSVFRHAQGGAKPLPDYRVPRPWWPWLGSAKVAAAARLLVGPSLPFMCFCA